MKQRKNNNGSNSGRKPDVSAFQTRLMGLRACQYKRQGYDDTEIAEKMGRCDRTIRRWIQHYHKLEYGQLEQLANDSREIYWQRFWTWQARADELDHEIDELEIAQANGESVDERRLEVLRVQRDRAIAEADRWKPMTEKTIDIVAGALVKRHSQKSDVEAPAQLEYNPEARYAIIRQYRQWPSSKRETESGPDEKNIGRTDHGNRQQK
jgi:predicted transcriptional regulator